MLDTATLNSTLCFNMRSRTSPSPSPPPAVPTESASGPRATALQKVYNGALRATLSSNSYANFSSCFPTPAKYCPTALEGVWKQLNSRLQEECTKDFEKICEERDITRSLNVWDRSVEEALKRKARAVDGENPGNAPHTLTGDELYNAYLAPFLAQTEQELQDRLQKTQSDNIEAMAVINRQRAEIASILDKLEAMIQDVEGSATVLEKNLAGQTSLKSEIWQMEQEVANIKT